MLSANTRLVGLLWAASHSRPGLPSQLPNCKLETPAVAPTPPRTAGQPTPGTCHWSGAWSRSRALEVRQQGRGGLLGKPWGGQGTLGAAHSYVARAGCGLGIQAGLPGGMWAQLPREKSDSTQVGVGEGPALRKVHRPPSSRAGRIRKELATGWEPLGPAWREGCECAVGRPEAHPRGGQ